MKSTKLEPLDHHTPEPWIAVQNGGQIDIHHKSHAEGREITVVADVRQRDKELIAAAPKTARLYNELLMAVCRCFPGESRHETALRYILESERSVLQDNAVNSIPVAANERQ